VHGTTLRLFTDGRKNPGPQFRVSTEVDYRGIAGIQIVQLYGKKSLFPSDDGRSCSPQSPLDDAERSAVGQHRDHLAAEDVSGSQRAGLDDAAEFELLADEN
jgi:hypothetical protein